MQSIRYYIRLFIVGLVFGVANIIPGVSGGTIAVIFGIYEDLMEALSGILSNKEKRKVYLTFLGVLFLAVIISIFSFARILSWAYENYALLTVYFFMGLILGGIPVVLKKHPDMKPNRWRVVAGLSGVLLVMVLAALKPDSPASDTISGLSRINYWQPLYFFLAGIISSSAMIIPGISGSFMLLLLGVYWDVLAALSGLTDFVSGEQLWTQFGIPFSILGPLGMGIIIGIFVFARIMNWALKHYPAITMYGVLGLIIGSFYQIYPGFELSLMGLGAIITFLTGLILSFIFAKM